LIGEDEGDPGVTDVGDELVQDGSGRLTQRCGVLPQRIEWDLEVAGIQTRRRRAAPRCTDRRTHSVEQVVPGLHVGQGPTELVAEAIGTPSHDSRSQ